MNKIYMDYNATTPVRPEVFDAMLPFFREQFGNPSSVHWAGRAVSGAVEKARQQVATLINCSPAEIVFVSCGSEGDNMAIKGTAAALADRGKHIITTTVEHPAVLETCRFMEKQGYAVTYLPVDRDGMLDLQELEAAITPETILISVMWANNETGNIFPIEEIGAIARKNKVRFHSDAVQAVGKLPVDVQKANVDLLVLSGHKLGAPKGVGAIYIRKGTRMHPLIHGGHQERSRRAGTHNVAGIVGFGLACELAGAEIETCAARIGALRDRLEAGIKAAIPEIKLNGHPDPARRLPNTLNVSFAYIEGESLLLNFDIKGIAASSGSACTSGSLEPSHVMGAMCVDVVLAHSSTRFSLGRDNTEADVDYVLEVLPPIVQRLREMSPLYNRKEPLTCEECSIVRRC
ncbi:cysteine desulfurase NifS [Desulfuromonas carbonis]|uniref:cysteine desulfurase NifS n=1 Tax=Desulfuromonas sp. DDH964 TaxID=1823759 RepID=UPI00078C36F8|nr:cysteine desulfurase NifS [Desulfuromonas sp. DDH964]AMV72461.1 nitrogen fixation iron-sulfur cluster assembly cysteine desulfurase NifS [Desulfuromonas sp. DDH964]